MLLIQSIDEHYQHIDQYKITFDLESAMQIFQNASDNIN